MSRELLAGLGILALAVVCAGLSLLTAYIGYFVTHPDVKPPWSDRKARRR